MEVTLVDYTKDAIEKLILTKNTRLQGQLTLNEIMEWDNDRKTKELDYIFNTIKSSLEFVDFTFLIEGVSRNFTHQLVRTRKASYAQESLRAVDVSNRGFVVSYKHSLIDEALDDAMFNYMELLDANFEIQEAREILPSSICTSIMMKIDLRELSHMAEQRLCYRASGEYQKVFKEIKKVVTGIYPQFEKILRVACAQTGICIFPNYTKCPIQRFTVKVSQEDKDAIQEEWAAISHVADPGIYK